MTRILRGPSVKTRRSACFSVGMLACLCLSGCDDAARSVQPVAVSPPVPETDATPSTQETLAPPEQDEGSSTARREPSGIEPSPLSARSARDRREAMFRPPPVAASDAAPARPRGLPSRKKQLTFDDLKFDIEKGEPFEREMLTQEIEALVGQTVHLSGFMLPSFQQSGLIEFVLVRDNMECCFGPGAALYDCVYVKMNPGKTADFNIRPVTVSGEFRIEEFIGADGMHLAIFEMRADSVR